MLTLDFRDNTTLTGTPGKVDPDKIDLPPDQDLAPAPIDQDDLEEWFYIDRASLDTAEASLETSALRIVLDMC